MGIAGTVLKALGLLLVVLLAAAGVAYAMDVKLAATVEETRCGLDEVDIRTDLLSIDHTLEVPRSQCVLLQPGNYVEYHVRSQRTTVYDHKGGDCLFDSATGVGCGKGSGGGLFG